MFMTEVIIQRKFVRTRAAPNNSRKVGCSQIFDKTNPTCFFVFVTCVCVCALRKKYSVLKHKNRFLQS